MEESICAFASVCFYLRTAAVAGGPDYRHRATAAPAQIDRLAEAAADPAGVLDGRRIRIVLAPAYTYTYLDAGAGCEAYGVGAAVVCGRGVACTWRDFGLAVFSGRDVFSGREVNFFGVGVPPLTMLKFSLRYLRNMARFGSSAAAMRRSCRPASR